MRDVEKLVRAHLNVWTIPDREERVAEIAHVYAQDVTIVEPDGVLPGRDALNTRIGQLQQQSEDVTGWDVPHFDGDLIHQAVMFIPRFDWLNVPAYPAGRG
jgi:hypothetical protein